MLLCFVKTYFLDFNVNKIDDLDKKYRKLSVQQKEITQISVMWAVRLTICINLMGSALVTQPDNPCTISNCVHCNQIQEALRCTICADDYYINDAGTCSLCPSNCTTCTSQYCTSCKAGYYGNVCSLPCDANCVQTTCNQNDGRCTYKCQSGHFQSGFYCPLCSEHIDNCEECTDAYHCTRCAAGYNLWKTGGIAFCKVGCPLGTWGDTCQYVCSSNCVKNCSGPYGDCNSCSDGFYGNYCNRQCPDGCYQNNGIDICDRVSGRCNIGCKVGRLGVYCDVVDGQWGQWSDYGPCSVTCGRGSRSRFRSCDNPAPFHGGQLCRGNKEESTACNLLSCHYDGQWGQWSDYGPCSVTCGRGSRSRFRLCDNPAPLHGGQLCRGNKEESTACNLLSCPFSEGNNQRPTEDGQTEDGWDYDDTKVGSKNGALVGGAAGGGSLFVIVGVVLVVIFISRRHKQSQNCKKAKQVLDENVTPAAANVHDLKNNSYNSFLIPEGSRQAPADHQGNKDEYSYSLLNKNNTKSNEGTRRTKEKSEDETEVLHNLKVPLKSDMEEGALEIIIEHNISEMDYANGRMPEVRDYNTTADLAGLRTPVEKLAITIAGKPADDFLQEFQKLAVGLSRDYKAAVRPENKYRNRYKKIFAYDETRVKLIGCSSDYINANYVDGYRHSKAYIACQGPTETTTDKFALFWTMIWQQKVEKIVMLTRLMEGENMKCEQYWPETDSESYGDIMVHQISEINYAEFTIRNLYIVKASEGRRVCHIHYLAWPDYGVPGDVTSLLEFRHKVISVTTGLNGPTVVHCSAGIGRTGTYIALDMLIHEGSVEKSVDVFACVNRIRGERANLVQNVDQYKFLHHALVHELTLPSQMLPPEHIACFVTGRGCTALRRQFQQLQTVTGKTPGIEAESTLRNRDFKKNRKGADIPGDRYRVKLNTKQPGCSDYINATSVNGYFKEKQFIVAQTPLSETLVDFVELIMQEDIACIVSMDPDITQDKTAGVYLPSTNQSLNIGNYTISCIKRESLATHVFRILEVSNWQNLGEKTKTVYHFQPTLWHSNEPIPSAATDFVLLVSKVDQMAGKNGGTLIHCLNAAERSGLFCVVAILIQKLSYEKKLSVINTLRQFRSIRQKAIPDEDQYIFCHECVVAYQTSVDNTYTNVNWRK